MKLILTQEVANLGGPGELVEVKDGYGRNYLIPRGLAVVATKGAERQVAEIRRAREVREVRNLAQAKELAAQLDSLQVRLPARAGAGGKLFGSVTAVDVADAVVASGGPRLDRRRIELAAPIKALGQYTVTVRLHPDVASSVVVEVAPAAKG